MFSNCQLCNWKLFIGRSFHLIFVKFRFFFFYLFQLYLKIYCRKKSVSCWSVTFHCECFLLKKWFKLQKWREKVFKKGKTHVSKGDLEKKFYNKFKWVFEENWQTLSCLDEAKFFGIFQFDFVSHVADNIHP